MPSCFAARAGDNPAAMSFSAAETVSGSSGGRPGVRPRFLAAAMPSQVRSEMSRPVAARGCQCIGTGNANFCVKSVSRTAGKTGL